MAQASDYPVTFGYLEKWGSYTHRGEDRAMPSGTPIIINGVKIGLSGNTGMSSGAHVHLQCGKDQYAQATIKPSNYWFKGEEVVRTGTGSEWGNYVIVYYKGVYCVYAHLSKILVKKGDKLMANKPKLTLTRIIWSEVFGKDFNLTHKGVFDKAITRYVGTKDWAQYVNSAWNHKDAKAFRAKRTKAMKYYDLKGVHDTERKVLNTTITNLEKQVKDLEAQLAVQSDDTTNLNALGTALKWFITRLGVK